MSDGIRKTIHHHAKIQIYAVTILAVCIIYCIQFNATSNCSVQLLISAITPSQLLVLQCTSHACFTLATTYPTTGTIIIFFQRYFGVQIRWFFTSLTAFQLVYLLPPRFLCQRPHIWPKMDLLKQQRFGHWIYNSIYIKDASTYLGILIQAWIPYCPGSVKISRRSDTIWPRNSF